jgi:hypothetical protein
MSADNDDDEAKTRRWIEEQKAEREKASKWREDAKAAVATECAKAQREADKPFTFDLFANATNGVIRIEDKLTSKPITSFFTTQSGAKPKRPADATKPTAAATKRRKPPPPVTESVESFITRTHNTTDQLADMPELENYDAYSGH